MLTRAHEPFYADQVAGMPSTSVLIQPSNRGTAPAILYSLMRLREMDPKGVVAFFPSDHYFSDDEAFISHIDSAYAIASLRPEVVVLLGVTPETPEVEYGWIEPGNPLENSPSGSVYHVSRFWEKPHETLASSLMERGCLWNSFVMIGHVNAFMSLIRHTLPELNQIVRFHSPSSIHNSGTVGSKRPLFDDTCRKFFRGRPFRTAGSARRTP